MAKLTYEQVYTLARQSGLPPAKAVIATAISMAESGFNTGIQGDINLQDGKWGPSVGLWQVRSLVAQKGTGGTRDAAKLTDPAANAKSMFEISNGGTNWKPWSVYLHGTYKKYLGQATTVAATVDGDPSLAQKVAASLLNVPGVGAVINGGAAVVSGGAGAVTDGVAGVAASLNPFATWREDAQGVLLKTGIVGVAGALFVAGALRLVVPAAVSETRRATGI